jgi:hypothetical protein
MKSLRIKKTVGDVCWSRQPGSLFIKPGRRKLKISLKQQSRISPVSKIYYLK